LRLDAGERETLLLRLQHARRPGIDIEEVVRLAVAVLQLELAQRHAAGGLDVRGLEILHRPPRRREQAVDLGACLLFGLVGHHSPLRAKSSALSDVRNS
jgi:hypothetical protein